MAVDAAGNLYIADFLNNCIRKVNTSGIISTIAGGLGAGFSGDGGPATSANLSNPISVWIDVDGSIVFSDNGNARIRKINTAGVISTIAGIGSFGYSGDGGPATGAQLRPNGVTTDASGNMYIADGSNHRIRKVTPPPVTVSGTTTVCEGSTTTFTGSVTGGTWSSSSAANATVDAAGVVTGVASGTAIISYIATTGTGTRNVTVFVQPAAISGTTTVCIAATTTLSCATSGGTWASSAPATASVDAAGTVTGVAAGTATISYALGSCFVTTTITVDACPTFAGGITPDQLTAKVMTNVLAHFLFRFPRATVTPSSQSVIF